MSLRKLLPLIAVAALLCVCLALIASGLSGCSSLPRGARVDASGDSLVVEWQGARVVLLPADSVYGSFGRMIATYPPAYIDVMYHPALSCVVGGLTDSTGRVVYSFPRQCIEMPGGDR